ncbi:hypothetical protein CNMCM7691_003563 [Aspergillus felis]|uniref:Polyketide synthase n=1 Tax=Aspergillus felis TaxID=1287682 RepID=A0A8H6R2V1_9EURO|nr:hypothetical protein CNMCM7691_003563 [Aspergillus felis]
MEDKLHSTLELHQVAFFGGQGSRAVFSQEASATAIRHARRSRTAGKLLASCYNAFVQELSNASEQEHGQSVLTELAELTSSELLLSPPATQQSNPIIQGVSLLIHQLLSYLNHVETFAASPEPPLSLQAITSKYDEVMGFCSGIIPALIVATSTSIEDFIQGSDNAVRLAFWIGYRVASFCEDRAGPQWRALPWSIAVSGLKEEDVVRFNSKDGNETVSFSGRINTDIITVTGTPSALERFQIFSKGNGEPVPVHGWYHGGDTTKSVVHMVLQDITRRSISFPAIQSLYIPVRSTVDGNLMTLPGGVTLAETAVQTILTHTLNWQLTCESLSLGPLNTEVHAFGPHSRSLFGTQWNNTRVVDHSLPEMPKIPPADIAIVGMSVNFPSANNKEALWNNLMKGINTVQTIPETRFKVSEYISDDPEGKPGLRSIYGNFVEKPWAFDHAFFDISPREARSMDPQQKLLLQATLHALDDAGYVPDSTPSFQKDSVGCYVGIATGDYVDNLRDDIDVYYSTGTLRAFLSGRISYNFKFSGPSMVVDTACSASSVAMYQACQALVNGDCTAAIAGGANAMVSPDMYMGLGRAHFLSPTGQCKAFDAGADGYCRSEGCGVFVLKRLSDALEENDRIYGVIRGIAVSQSANSSSITRPHSETQAKLFRTVLSRAGVDASSVDVVEAHGTGTQAGDAVEICSIQSVFGKVSRHRQNRVFVTSIKGNIGHAEAASGAASLAKVLLMLKNHRIPPQVGLKKINPRLAGALSTDMQITTEGTNWKAPAGNLPRRAMVNNFGAAGSNAVMIVEEAPPRHSQVTERSAYPFLISARTVKALKTRVQAYRRSIEASRSSLNLPDICYTATARRQRYEHIVSIACGNVDDLLAKLRDPHITRTPSERRPMIMVFSGQGGAYSGMGRELLSTSPVYRTCVDRCESLLEQMRFPSIRGMLVGDVSIEDSNNTYLSQTGTFVLEYALASVWRAWGIEPQAVIGHSLGEYAAMVIAGVMSLADGLRLVATRATLIADLCTAKKSGMMACNQSDQELLRLISHHEGLSHLQVACQNTPHDSVIAGPIIELQLLAELCKQSGYKCKILAVPYGFHSAAMDPILEELRKIASSVTYYPAKILVGSTVYGDFLSSVVDSDYFVRQTSDTVRFAQLLQAITADQDLSSAVFLEIGPSPLTLPMVRSGLSEHGEYGFLGSLNSKLSAWESLSNAVVNLSSFYPDINWRAVFVGTGASVVDAPAYPLEQFENFVPYRVAPLDKPKEETTRPRDAILDTGLLTTKLRGSDRVFETPVEYLAPYIDGHVVGEVALCPASIYHEMVVEAASLNGVRPDQTIVITDLTFDNPLVYDVSPDDRIVQLRLEKEKLFQFSSYSPLQPDNCTVHCCGTVSLESIATTTKAFTRKAAMIQRQLSHLKLRREHFDTFNTNILYETIFSRVVRYAESYRSIRQLTVADTGLEGYGTFKLPIVQQKCILSPTFIDTLLHSVGFMANNYAASSEVYICAKVESAQILFHDVDQKDSFSIYCSLLNCDDNMLIADSYALSSSGRLVAAVEGIHFKKLNLRAFRTHLSRYRTDVGLQSIEDSSSTASSASSEDSISTGESPLSTPVNGYEEAMAIAQLVTKVVSKICGIDLGSSSSSALLSELGIDSLMAIEIGATLQKSLPMVHLDSSTIMGIRTIGELTREVENLSGKRLQLPTEIRSKPSRRTSGRRDECEKAKSSDNPDRGLIKAILAGVCGVSESALRADQSLSAYGFDSLLSIEFRQAFRKKLKIEMPADQLHGDLSIRELEDLILGMGKPTNRARDGLQNSVRPVQLQKGDSESVPLILVHDGSGSVAPYSKLKKVPFPLYGISSPSLTLEGPTPATLKETAELYADAIRSKFDRPVVIGGWSFGGVLAFEIAQHLMSQAAGVVFIDSPSPINHQPLPDAVIRHVLQDLDAGTQVLLRTQFTSYAAMLGEYRPSKMRTDIPSVLLQCEQTLNTTELCNVEYPWLENEAAQQDSISQWNTLLHTKMLVLKIPGNHFEPFKLQNVTKVTERLVEAYNFELTLSPEYIPYTDGPEYVTHTSTMATTVGGFTFADGYRQSADTNPWEVENEDTWDKEEPHYSVPPSVELLTSSIHNDMGLNYLRTWPTIYDGTASPHGVPSWWQPKKKVDVLICGAGPTGLQIAVSLVRQGLTVRIIDKASGPLLAGRADGVQPRFLETLGTWGLAEEVAEEGPLIERTAIYKNGKPLLHSRSHQSDSRYRGLHVITQGQIERIYVRDLYRHKVLVDRTTVLKEYKVEDNQSDPHPVKGVITNTATGEEEVVEAKFLVGSDGGASSIRRGLGIPFDGVSTDIYWGIMDCVFESDYPHAWIFGSVISSKHGGCVIIPREQGYIRLYTQLDVSSTGPIAQSRLARDPNFQESGGRVDVHSITADEVLEQANRIFAPYKLKFAAPLSWFAVWKISERVARSFSSENLRVYLAGDAAHVHSVMGAFGLNASILDSANLAWKLGLCASSAADIKSLMPTYDRERRLHAVRIIETSGKYLRFVCNSELPIAQLYEAGADLGFDPSRSSQAPTAKNNEASNGKANGDHGKPETNGQGHHNGVKLSVTNGDKTNGHNVHLNGKPQSTSEEEAERQEDLQFLRTFFPEYGQFLLGTDCEYGTSCIAPQESTVETKKKPTVLRNGVRAPSPRVCFSTNSTGYLYDKMKGPHRFHVVVFGSDLLGPVRARLAAFSLALARESHFYKRFGGRERFNILLVAKGTPFELEERLQGDDLSALKESAVVISDDRTPEDDAHSCYGVDHVTGAVVVVRPDLWVGKTAAPDQVDELDRYFSAFLIPVDRHT